MEIITYAEVKCMITVLQRTEERQIEVYYCKVLILHMQIPYDHLKVACAMLQMSAINSKTTTKRNRAS